MKAAHSCTASANDEGNTTKVCAERQGKQGDMEVDETRAPPVHTLLPSQNAGSIYNYMRIRGTLAAPTSSGCSFTLGISLYPLTNSPHPQKSCFPLVNALVRRRSALAAVVLSALPSDLLV